MTSHATPLTPNRPISERVIEALLFAASAVGVLTTVGIVGVLVIETVEFFLAVSPIEFLTGTRWSALIKPNHWGVLPLINGTLIIAGIGLVIAVPLGLLAAVLLSDYASPRVRNIVKPILETIAGVPTIVLGFFAVYFLSPNVLEPIFTDRFGGTSALAAGIVVGVLITPLIASISEDAMTAVPRGLREGAYAMGATKFEVVRHVVFPAAISGIMASIILAMSRAIGETMAVVLAGGSNPTMTLNPLLSIQTMTAFIAQISQGDTPQGSTAFYSLFAVAMVLFVMTFVLNIVSARIVRRFRTAY